MGFNNTGAVSSHNIKDPNIPVVIFTVIDFIFPTALNGCDYISAFPANMINGQTFNIINLLINCLGPVLSKS